MQPSKVTLRPKVRRPMAWDSTKSASSAQQPEPSTQCPIPGGYRRAETRPHRGRYSTRFVERIHVVGQGGALTRTSRQRRGRKFTWQAGGGTVLASDGRYLYWPITAGTASC